jgi:integrase
LSELGGPGIGRRSTSHVYMKDHPDWGPYVFFYKTKNGRSHRMPLTPMALELLKRRQTAAADEAARRGFGAKSRGFVFPARSPFSKSGHYSDATDLLDDLREEIDLEKLNRHDLRRSFGAVMRELEVPEGIMSRFLNHARTNVTETYTAAEWSLLRHWMMKIEQSIIVKAPNVYNSLKPADWPPIHAPEPHICRPPKPRTGRPPKTAKVSGNLYRLAEKSEND